jgi:cytidyltransferase-like protein
MKKVLIFGAFDGVHDGHRDLFRQARLRGDYLIVAVAPDNIVQQLKHRLPKLGLAERVENVAREPGVDEAIAGDELLGSYNVVKSRTPDVIALGYDQKDLQEDLEARKDEFGFDVEIVVLEPYQPEQFHNSLLDGSL